MCRRQRGHCAGPPAGWGGAICRGAHGETASRRGTPAEPPPFELYCGPVILDPAHADFVGAEAHTNNTGEMSAMANMLRMLLSRNDRHDGVIYHDSEYTAQMARALWTPNSNKALARTLRELYKQVKQQRQLRLQKIRARAMADRCADEGARGTTDLPRMSAEVRFIVPRPGRRRHRCKGGFTW